MSSQKRDALIGFTVYGYIRDNFDKKCWIDEIMATIVEFYMSKGGKLYVRGTGKNGRLGIEFEQYVYKDFSVPTLCPSFMYDNAYAVSASNDHTLILDIFGDVWCCGAGSYGKLGNGKTEDLYVPKKLNLHNRVIAISAGGEHSLLLCVDGTVKGFGLNHYGQLAIDDLKKIMVPKTIEKLKEHRVTQICAGEFYSAVLTEDGELFCFGINYKGVCGVGDKNKKSIKTPTKVDFDDEIEYVDCGNTHSLVITCKGSIYSFGAGVHGKLGHGDEENKYVPALIASLKERRMTVCAAGYRHSLCIDKEGTIWGFGDNYSRQRIPQMIEWFIENNIKAKECAAGCHSSCVFSTDGTLYEFGRRFGPSKISLANNMTAQSVSMGKNHSAIICA